MPILIVDDEPEILNFFELSLNQNGITNTITCGNGRKALSIIKEQDLEMILLDLMMPKVSGEVILNHVMTNLPDIPVIMITGVYEVDTAVRCMKLGAFDYLLKPIEEENLLMSVSRAMEVRELRHENTMLVHKFLSDKLKHPEHFSDIITNSSRMRSIFYYCEAIAAAHYPVLITGETGTGKELIAKAIHASSGRRGEFIAVNVAGVDDNVFSDTLFGHTRGAFTGADQKRSGLIEKAENGTLLLDEIGDLSMASQVKLLRLLEQREYFPIGSDIPRIANVRILVTTHKNLEDSRLKGEFRTDLYFRLCNHKVTLPPLRERKEDIPLFLDHFLAVAASECRKKIPAYHPELITLLENYNFPGNIREFKALVADAVSRHDGRMLSHAAFKNVIQLPLKSPTIDPVKKHADESGDDTWATNLDPLPKLKEADLELIREALKRSGGNQTVAAMMLGISPQALSKRLKRLNGPI
ncbi:MAG: sigma-54-dependent Fis family transcriptional regulator [Candidatus Glassbacteria bacterium]|nr:sigma-54-dependent Fis family transcriptional regulator [Candidatus Glassbacteria bacterium]